MIWGYQLIWKIKLVKLDHFSSGENKKYWKPPPRYTPYIIGAYLLGISHLANGPWNKSLNFIFPTKYVIPKSLKFSHWPSKISSPFKGLQQGGFQQRAGALHPKGVSNNFPYETCDWTLGWVIQTPVKHRPEKNGVSWRCGKVQSYELSLVFQSCLVRIGVWTHKHLLFEGL